MTLTRLLIGANRGDCKKLADEVERGLEQALPGLRKTVVKKLARAVGAMMEAPTPNTVELANLLPLATERQDMREQWLRRLLKNPVLRATAVMEPFTRAARHGQPGLLSIDQTDLGNRMAVLIVVLRAGDRVLPLAWLAEVGPANIGFEGQRKVLEQVLAWLPAGVKVLLLADRFYPSAALFAWLDAGGWGSRRRLKGNVLADTGHGDETTPGGLAQGVAERYRPEVRQFAQGVRANLGIRHQAGHPQPWIIAMDCAPGRAAVLDYAARWAIEPMFADFTGRGFDLEDSPLWHADRLERRVLIRALAMPWCVRGGQDDAHNRPTPLEKTASAKRPGALELQEAPPPLGLLVHLGSAPPEAMPAKWHPFARLLGEYRKVIGDEPTP